MQALATHEWKFDGFQKDLGRTPLIMGIVNVTPDSFSDGGRYLAQDSAVQHALQLVSEGADILDVGGESTRPCADLVSTEEELHRVIPVIKLLAQKTDVPISIDTSKADVAREALSAGARIVNDISGLSHDPRMVGLCRESKCGIVCMHMQGTPQTMQISPAYNNVVEEICEYLSVRLDILYQEGIEPGRVVFDPGIGFGKTAQHNMEILASVRRLRALGRPILIGHSRKRFLQKVIGRSVDERLFGTVGISVAMAAQHVDILRVHDVAANRDAILAFQSISEMPEIASS